MEPTLEFLLNTVSIQLPSDHQYPKDGIVYEEIPSINQRDQQEFQIESFHLNRIQKSLQNFYFTQNQSSQNDSCTKIQRLQVKIPFQMVEAKRNNKKIKKENKRQKQYEYQMIKKNAFTIPNSSSISYVFRLIPEKKIFFLAGDIVVEIVNQGNDESDMILNECKNIVSIESDKKCITINTESIRPIKQLNQAIYFLENSQSQENYTFAQQIKTHQQTIFYIEGLIQKAIDSYSPRDLTRLLKERENYMKNEKKKMAEQSCQKDEFVSIGSLSLCFKNKTVVLSNMTFTRPSLAVIGINDEQLIEYIQRKGLVSLFNYDSRKVICSLCLETQNMNNLQSGNPQNLQFEIPNFEIFTLDNIKIDCHCSISCIQIQFPEHLLFVGENVAQLNSKEYFIFIKYDITKEHIQTILNLRQGKENFFEASFRENIAISNLEYSIQRKMFLEKYYKDEYDKLEDQIKQEEIKIIKTPCGYKHISQS